ncbi:MAG: glycine zipper 2TM domain-containing protein, partial [Burkholderiales bacterium]
VERVREVQIEGRRSAVGAIGGGAIGGIAGSTVGTGKGSAISSVVGAIIGGVAGSTVEEKVTARPGLEITVRLGDDKLVAVVQEADEQFKVGERVRILSGQGTSRVTR